VFLFRVHQDDVEMGNLPRTRSSGDDDDEILVVSRKEETGKCFKAKVLRRVFSEDYEKEESKILDPRGQRISQWSKIFLAACLVSLFVDPLFLFLPTVRALEVCVETGKTLQVILTIIRSVGDVFYVINIFVRFHTAYVAPSSRVFGRGELVIDPSKVALRYLRSGVFWIDLIAALPLPQVRSRAPLKILFIYFYFYFILIFFFFFFF
jgi:cyclic nucleotide gated channel